MDYITYQKRLNYLLGLIEKGQLNSPLEMAVKFDCSERTIRRMIKRLCDIGINIKYCKKTKYTGYEYDLSTDDYYPFKYTREYKEDGNVYKTIYKIYHPTKGHHAFTVTATHYKSEKKVRVDVEQAGGGIFAHICDEKTTYDTPSMKAFGFRGSVGALGGDRVPNQLMVKFVSAKYENVKVVHINATEPGTSKFYFYVLDEK